MLLRFYLFSTVTGCDEPVNRPYCDEIFAGIEQAEQEAFGTTNTDNWDDFFTTLPEEGELETLGIQSTPAFIVYDVDRQLALFKLEKDEIKKANVAAACVAAWQLSPDPTDQEGYITEGGAKVTQGELLNATPCPAWLPSFMCNGSRAWSGWPSWLSWLLIFVLIYVIYKMLR